MKQIILSFLFISFLVTSWAGPGHEIKVKIKGYQKKELYLAYHYGDKQYVNDTAFANTNGEFIFKGEAPLASGLYLVVMAPDNSYFQLAIDQEDQFFSIETDVTDILQKMVFRGTSKNNVMFTDYLKYLSKQGVVMNELQKKLSAAEKDKSMQKDLQMQIDLLNKKVRTYQQDLIASNKGSLPAAIIKAGLQIEVPEFSGNEEEQQLKKWRFFQQHYFDNFDLTNDRLLRTPVLHSAVEYYIEKLQIQHPDTLSAAIDNLLAKFSPKGETFKFYVIYFLNKYAKSNIVGMDAVYVHLAKKYYATGRATWADKKEVDKIIENANALEPLLIGRTASVLKLITRDGKGFKMDALSSKYNVLFFWKNDSKRTAKDFEELKKFNEKYKLKGVRLIAVCMDEKSEQSKSWQTVEENKVSDWTHLCTENIENLSKILQDYSLKSMPKIFILDSQNKIIFKQIEASQLAVVIDSFLK